MNLGPGVCRFLELRVVGLRLLGLRALRFRGFGLMRGESFWGLAATVAPQRPSTYTDSVWDSGLA